MSCFVLFMHMIPCAFVLALARAGRSMLARIAIMAMTTSNSIRVKPRAICRAEGVRGWVINIGRDCLDSLFCIVAEGPVLRQGCVYGHSDSNWNAKAAPRIAPSVM